MDHCSTLFDRNYVYTKYGYNPLVLRSAEFRTIPGIVACTIEAVSRFIVFLPKTPRIQDGSLQPTDRNSHAWDGPILPLSLCIQTKQPSNRDRDTKTKTGYSKECRCSLSQAFTGIRRHRLQHEKASILKRSIKKNPRSHHFLRTESTFDFSLKKKKKKLRPD